MLTLDDLLTSEGRASFLNAFSCKSRWHLSVARAPAVQALLPWAQIDCLISNSLVPVDRFRIALNGNDVASRLYCDDRNHLRPDAVQGFATQGATLIINNIGALVPAIGDFAIVLERELRCRVQVNCYISFGAVSAFIPHHDAHDVLILQIHGAKRWRSFGKVVALPLTGGRPPVDEQQPEWEGQMEPGDLLYLPRGEVHAAIPKIRPSVHLTIGMTDATGVDFLQWLATKAKDIEALRRDLGAMLCTMERANRDKEFVSALHDLLDQSSIADFFIEQDREQAIRPLATLGAGENGGGRFRAETHLISALRRRMDPAADQVGEILVTFGKRKLRLSNLSRRILAEVTDRHRITVADLASKLDREVDDSDLIACLEGLAGKSLIAIGN